MLRYSLPHPTPAKISRHPLRYSCVHPRQRQDGRITDPEDLSKQPRA